MRRVKYRRCDVFSDRPLTGNALGVFLDADALADDELQALAREMNLSECAFVLRASSPDADARLRIFTPTMELPFAGHPTLGSAFVLSEGASGASTLRLETARGISTVSIDEGERGARFGWMTQPLPRVRAYEHARELLSALHVAGSRRPIELYDNGPHYVLVALERPEQVAALEPDMAALARLGSIAVSVFAPLPDARWKARVFAPGEGIDEDPATGAAAGPLALHLARHGRIAFGDTILIEQGAELARPSLLHARAHGNAERVEQIEVGGHAVVIGGGEIELPGGVAGVD